VREQVHTEILRRQAVGVPPSTAELVKLFGFDATMDALARLTERRCARYYGPCDQYPHGAWVLTGEP
jgi:hypothetical protein